MNISLSEILLVLVIALLVIKPEQLPDVALNLGRFAKMVRHLFTQMKNQVNELIDVTGSPPPLRSHELSNDNKTPSPQQSELMDTDHPSTSV